MLFLIRIGNFLGTSTKIFRTCFPDYQERLTHINSSRIIDQMPCCNGRTILLEVKYFLIIQKKYEEVTPVTKDFIWMIYSFTFTKIVKCCVIFGLFLFLSSFAGKQLEVVTDAVRFGGKTPLHLTRWTPPNS